MSQGDLKQSRTAVIRVEMADTSASPAPRKRRSFKSPRISAFAPVIAKPVIKVKVTTPTTTALIIEAEKKKQRKFRERMSPLKTGSSMVKAPPRRSERKARRSGTPKTRFAKRRDYTAACKRASTPTAMCSEMRSLRRVPLKKRHRSLQRTQTDPKLHSVLNGDALLRQDSSKTASLLSTVIDDVADAHSSAGGRTAAGRRRKRSSKKRLRHSLPPASPRMEACKSAPFPVTLPLSKSASTPMCDSPSIEKITSDKLQKKSAKDDFFGSFESESDLELQRSETFEDNCLGDLVSTSSLTATTRGSVERGRVRGQRPESSRVFRERDESLHSEGSGAAVVGCGLGADCSSVGSGGTVRSVRTLSSGSRSRSPVLAETIDSMIESTLGARNRSRSGERVPAADSLTPAGSERSRTESVESGMSESDDFGTVIAPPSDFRGRSAERRRRSSSQKRSLSPANILFSDPSMDAVAIASGGARLGHRLSLTCPELRGVPLPPPKVCDDVSQPSATGRITSDSETSRRRSFRIREESRSPSRTRTRTASPRRLSALFGRADAGQWTASEMSAQSRELKRQNMALIVDLALRTVASVRVDNAESWVLRWKLSHWHWEPPPTAAPTEDARSNLQTLFGANRRQSFVESVDQLAAELSHPSAEVSKSKSKSAHTEEIEEGDDGDSDCVSTSVSTEDSDYKSDSRRKERRKVAGDFSELSESEVFERERECLESAERFKVAVKYAQMRVCFYEGIALAQQRFAESMASVCDAYSEGCSELSNDPRISDAVKLQMDEDLNVGDDYVELATGRRLAAIHNQLGECLAEACAKLRSTLLRSPLIATISRLDATKKQLQQCFDKTVQLKHYCKRLLRNVFAKSSDKFVSRLRKRIVKRRLPRGIGSGKHKAATYLISETPAKIKRLTTAVQRSVALQSVWKYLQCARRCNELRRRYYGQLVCRGLRHLSTGVLAAVNSVNEHRQGVGRVVEYWSAPGAAVPECELTPTIAELGFGQRPPHELDVEFMDDWRVLRAPVLYNEMDARPSEIHAVNECLWRDAFEMRCVAYGSEMMDDLMRKKPAKPQPSVGEVLGDTSLRNHFMKYLTQRCASENLSFLEAVALLRLATDQSVAKCLAQKIFSEFVVSGAPQMVNLSAHRRAHAVELMAKLRAEVCSDELRAAYKRQSLAILRKDYALRLSRVSAMPTLATHSSFEGVDCSRPMPVASALRVDATTRVRSHSAQVPATGRRPPRHKYTTTPVVCMDDGHLLTRGRQSSLSSLSTDSSSQRSAPRLLREADAHWDVATMFDHCFEEVASWMSSSIIPEFVHSAVFDAFLKEVLSKGKEAHSDEDSESALLKADSGLGAILQLKAARSLTQLFGRGKSKSPPSGSPSAVRRTGLFSAMRSRSKSREAKAVPQSVVGTGSAERGDRQLVAEEKASQIGDLPPVLSIAEATRRKKKKTHSLSLWKEDEKRRAKKTQGAKRKPDSGKRRKQAVAAVPTAARSKRKRTSLKKASEKRKRPKYKKRT